MVPAHIDHDNTTFDYEKTSFSLTGEKKKEVVIPSILRTGTEEQGKTMNANQWTEEGDRIEVEYFWAIHDTQQQHKVFLLIYKQPRVFRTDFKIYVSFCAECAK